MHLCWLECRHGTLTAKRNSQSLVAPTDSFPLFLKTHKQKKSESCHCELTLTFQVSFKCVWMATLSLMIMSHKPHRSRASRFASAIGEGAKLRGAYPMRGKGGVRQNWTKCEVCGTNTSVRCLRSKTVTSWCRAKSLTV